MLAAGLAALALGDSSIVLVGGSEWSAGPAMAS